MKRQITSFFFCFLTVVLLLSGFTHSVFSIKNLFQSNSQKVEQTIRLKKEVCTMATNEIEEEEDELFFDSHKVVFITPSPFYTNSHSSQKLHLKTKQKFIDQQISVRSLPIWLKTNKLII